MRRQSQFALISILVLAIIAVISLGLRREIGSRPNAPLANICRHDEELRTYQQWLQTVTFPYIGPEVKLRRVKDNYNSVEVGSSKAEVVLAFGPPDFEQEMAPIKANRPCIGYQFIYYFEKPEETVNEIKDKKIEVFFTSDGKVNWIVGNIGLAEKGGYAHRP